MPNTPLIQLDLRNSPCSDPGWRDIAASNGQTYSYRYSGGDDGAGGLVQTVGQGRDTATIQLSADPRYEISGRSFTGDNHDQLSWAGVSSRAATIVDLNEQVETAEYTLQVKDTANGDCTIQCDPPITNKPPAA